MSIITDSENLKQITDEIVDDISEHIAPRLHAIIRERIRKGDEPQIAHKEEVDKVVNLYQREIQMRYDTEANED